MIKKISPSSDLTSCKSNGGVRNPAIMDGLHYDFVHIGDEMGASYDDIYSFGDSNILTDKTCHGSHILACTIRMMKFLGMSACNAFMNVQFNVL